MKKLRLFATFLFLLFSIPWLTLSAAAAGTATVSISAPAVVVGNEVTVTVQVNATSNIGSWNFSIAYDPAALEYLSGADHGGGGMIYYAGAYDTAPSANMTFTARFRTKTTGSTKLSIANAEFVDDAVIQMMQVNDAEGTVTVNAPPVYSGDNNLSSLTVSPGTLSPTFSAGQTEYSVTVPYDVKNINVSAGKSHGAARVAISSTELSVGQNTVTVTVTAENGNRKQYFIRVTRTESELAGITAQINGENYTVAHEPSVLAIPQGYTQSLAKLGEKDILVFRSPKETVTVAYLFGAVSDWYLFDEAAQSFSPMRRLEASGSTLVVLPVKEEISVPKGYELGEISVNQQIFPAYSTALSAEKHIFLVYAMDQNGDCGFYFYDMNFQSVISYFEGTYVETVIREDVPGAAKDPLLENERNLARLRADRMEILALILGLAFVLMGVLAALLFVYRRRPKKKKSKDEVDEADLLLEDDNLRLNKKTKKDQMEQVYSGKRD